jgi:hypothetical protein
MRNFTWEMNSIGKVLVFYTDEMLEMCNVPIRISCQTNDLFSSIKFESQAVIFTFRLQDRCSSTQPDWFDSQFDNQLSNDIYSLFFNQRTTTPQFTAKIELTTLYTFDIG